MGATGPSQKAEYPPLLPEGLHPFAVAELRKKCVEGFPLSKTRAAIMSGIEAVYDRLAATKLRGALWIDGSFLTEKIDAKDADLLLRVGDWAYSRRTPDQDEAINWMKTDGARLGCDTYLHVDYPEGHVQFWLSHWGYAYWIKQYGYSRGEDVKGTRS